MNEGLGGRPNFFNQVCTLGKYGFGGGGKKVADVQIVDENLSFSLVPNVCFSFDFETKAILAASNPL